MNNMEMTYLNTICMYYRINQPMIYRSTHNKVLRMETLTNSTKLGTKLSTYGYRGSILLVFLEQTLSTIIKVLELASI